MTIVLFPRESPSPLNEPDEAGHHHCAGERGRHIFLCVPLIPLCAEVAVPNSGLTIWATAASVSSVDKSTKLDKVVVGDKVKAYITDKGIPRRFSAMSNLLMSCRAE